jgi:hypothetical protein
MNYGSQHHRASAEAPSLEGLFRALTRRLRWLVACRGAALAFATVIVLTVVGGTVDSSLHIEQPWLRAVLALSIVGIGAATALRLAVIPWLRRSKDVELALEIERRCPEWRDALASSLEFSAAGCRPVQGAPTLQRVAVARTMTRWNASTSGSLIDPRPCFRAIGLALASCLLAVTAYASNQGRAEVALWRLLSPYDCPDWPQRHNLVLLDADLVRLADPDKPLLLVAGAPAALYVDDATASLPDDVTLSLSHAEAPFRTIPLRQVSLTDAAGRRRNVWQALLPPDPQSYAVRATGGDDHSMPWYKIAFFPQPEIREVRMQLRSPPYLGLPEETLDAVPRSIDAFVGTHVRLKAQANVPLHSAVFRRDGCPAQNLSLSPDGLRFSVEFDVTAAERSSYWFELTDRHGLRSRELPRSELRGIEDAAPVVSIERPATDLTATPEAEVPLRIVARDDVKVTGARLMLSDPPGSVEERSLPLTMQAAAHVELNAVLPVADLRLAAGRQLTLRAEAEDAFEPGPRRVGHSSSKKLLIVTPDEKRGELLARQTGLVQGLERAGELQTKSLQQTRELRLQWQAAGSFQPADLDLLKRVVHDHSRIVADLGDDERGVAPRARALLAEFHWNRIDDEAADRRLRHLSDEMDRLLADVCPASERSLEQACKRTESSALEEERAEIDGLLAAAEVAQQEAADTLDALLALFAEWQQQYDLNRLASEIVATQAQINAETAATGRRTLTQQLSDLPPQDQADLARLADRQSRLARTLERFVENIDQLLAGSSRNNRGLSESELRDALEILRGKSVVQEMQRSGALIAENRIGDTLSRQHQVLQSLNELEQVLRGLGALDPETLLKRVREAEQEIETLRRQQSEALQRTTAFAESGRNDADARIDELQQQQRSLAEETSESARRLRRHQFRRPADGASRAADAMQRAAGLLQAATVPESTAAQQEAIDGLVQAQRDLANLRRQLEISQSASRFHELASIVQALGDRQQGLREETSRLDAQRRERGSLSRSQLATLRKLADSQSQLAADVAQLDASMVAAPVLKLALTVAASDMRNAADRLAARDTDAPTLALQDSALQRLRELHDVLVESQVSPEGPEGAPPGQNQDDEAVTDLTLVAQLRLITRMQAELTRRTEPLIELARRGQELTPGQQSERTQLAAEQARLAELLAGVLRGPDLQPVPPVSGPSP